MTRTDSLVEDEIVSNTNKHDGTLLTLGDGTLLTLGTHFLFVHLKYIYEALYVSCRKSTSHSDVRIQILIKLHAHVSIQNEDVC